MRYLATYLFAASLLIGELHTFFGIGVYSVQVEGKAVQYRDGKPVEKTSWHLFRTIERTPQNNVKHICDQVNFILYALMMLLVLRYPNRVNKAAAITLLFYSFIDMAMWWVNGKTHYYGYVYFLLPFIYFYTYKKTIR